ncbi:retrovirus-related pol polyprotein from transposon TNT 1-94 [Tanacetum coccineum]
MDDMIREKLTLKEQVDSLDQNLSKQIKGNESVLQTFAVFKNESKEKENKYMENEIDLEKKIKELDNIICKAIKNPFYLKKAQWIKPTLYDGVVMSNAHVAMPVIDDEETLILEEESRSKMYEKAKDLEVIAKKIAHKPIDYEKLNRLTEDFGKCFSPQQELSACAVDNSTIEPSYTPPVIVDVPSELPKVSLVNAILKKHKFHLTQFDSNALEEEYFEINDLKARLQNKDKTIYKLKDAIQSLRENTKEENVNQDKCDHEPINKKLENSVAKLLSKNECLCNEINHVKHVFKDQFDSIKQTCVRYKEQCDSLINKLNLKSVENKDLKAQIQDKIFVITSLKNDLQKLKGKEIVENVIHTPSITTIAPGMFKLDLVPLPPRELDFACKYATRIQKLLVYVQDTCPIAVTPSTKKVVVSPMNKVKKVRFAEPLTSSSNIIDYTLVSGLQMFKTHDRESLSAHEHSCALGKSKKSSHQPKAEDTNQEKLYLLHMDLCGPMRMASINGKRYILVIVDDYSRFTWVRFLKTKDEAPAAIIKCIKNIQFRLNATVQNVRTDNGTKFVSQTLREWQNRTLVEAARIMLIFSKAPLFLWAEAINTACYTQNRSLIRHRYNKTLYELMQDKKMNLSFLHVFGSLCYPTSDHEDLGKFDAKADIGFFSRPGLYYMTPATSSTGLGLKLVSQQPFQEAAAPRAKVLADSPVSTSID